MNNATLQNRVPEDLMRRIADCVNTALTDDIQRYLMENHPETTNAIPYLIGDFINTNIKTRIVGGDVEQISFKRYSWNGRILVDRANRVTYTIMRRKRLAQLRTDKRDKPHYLQSVVAVLNEEFVAPQSQMSLFDYDPQPKFDDETLQKDFATIVDESISRTNGYIHCVISYETDRGELTDINVLLLDGNLNEVERIPMHEYIKPDYSKLTNTYATPEADEQCENAASDSLVSVRRNAVETDETPVELHEERKQA